jgi:hypothetical protein
MSKKWVSIICLIFLMVTTAAWAKPDSAYIDNGNGTVTDIETKLMWQQKTAGPRVWYDAMSDCSGLSMAGYNDWRLPTIDELKTLLDRSDQMPPTINHTYFPDTVSSFYWSSTTNAFNTNYAWGVNFNYGNDYGSYKDYGYYVRAVRGGQPGALGDLVISPSSQTVTGVLGSTTFSVSNTGTGTIPWKAAITAGGDWLSISTGTGGTNTGTITCAYTANTGSASRTGTIQVTLYGTTSTSVYLTVIQEFLPAKQSQVPDTGQTHCYDVAGNVITSPSTGQSLDGQDAEYTINPMIYTKLDSSGNALPDSVADWTTVKDNATGLIWEMKTNKDGVMNYKDPHDADNRYTWYDSNPATNGGNSGSLNAGRNSEAFIKSLNDASYGGFSDWRMPTIKELAYLLNYRNSSGLQINTDYFPNTVSSFYWSSTSVRSNPRNAFGMNLSDGSDEKDIKLFNYYVRAVRGGQSGSSGSSVTGSLDSMRGASTANVDAFDSCTDNGDGTVTDTSSGLMWEQAGSSNEMRWEQALAYSEGLNCGGYTDWRLPTIKELRSLVDYSRYSPAIDTACFPKAAASRYWSSTTDPGSTSSAWCIHFNDGDDDSYDKSGNAYVRAVRGGDSGTSGNLVVSPLSRTVTQDAGSTTFSVSNTGTMFWAAAVTSGGDWLSISSGASGTNAGTVTCAYTGHTGTASRTGTIRVTAAAGSPIDVSITQSANSTACTAVIDSNYTLHVPRISRSNMSSYSADFAYNNDSAFPALILFRLTNAAIQSETVTCSAATLSNDLTIHIPDVLMPDGISRIWLDMAYSASLSSKENLYFYVSDYGVISK